MALRTPFGNDAKQYGFEWLRAMLEAGLQEGVFGGPGGAGGFKVTAAGAGGMRVDVAAGTALVKGDSGVPATGLSQGLFLAVNDALIANAVTLDAAHGSLPRVDQIVLRIYDTQDLATGADVLAIENVTGLATAGATLDNRNGAAIVGNDGILLADVLVPAASVAVSAGNVRDRRPWARGAYLRVVQNAAPGGFYSTVSATYVDVDATVLKPRLEFSGVPVRVGVHTNASVNSNIQTISFSLQRDGVSVGAQRRHLPLIASSFAPVDLAFNFTPAAGSGRISPVYAVDGGATATLDAGGSFPFVLTIEEIVRQNTENSGA